MWKGKCRSQDKFNEYFETSNAEWWMVSCEWWVVNDELWVVSCELWMFTSIWIYRKLRWNSILLLDTIFFFSETKITRIDGICTSDFVKESNLFYLNYEWWVVNYELWIVNDERLTVNGELWVMNYELWVFTST